MARWILDDAPFHSLACEIDEATMATWPGGELLVADATAQAASEDKSARRQRALAVTVSSGSSVIATFGFSVASAAGEILYGHLRSGGRGTANLAEHQSIAWALCEADDTIFVTGDKLAAMLALSELGRCKVCHPFELWAHLHETGRVSPAQYQRLLDRTYRADPSLPGVPWRLRGTSL